MQGGGTPAKTREEYWGGNIPWISPKDMKRDYISSAQLSITQEAVAHSAVKLIEAGSILFVVRGMILIHSFPVAVARVPLTINQDMKALALYVPEMGEFILRALKGLKREILRKVRRSTHGTCRIEGAEYCDLLVPIPPLAEQHRIVAKVDELMALCDRLEAAQAERERRRDRLAAASLHRLNNGVDAQAFREHARFHLHHLPRLTTRPEQIQQIRKTILNLAVRGRLVPQDANDEQVSTLVMISDRARQAVARGDRRADSVPQTLLGAEDRWEVPLSWAWRALADLVLFIDYRGQTPCKTQKGIRLITAKNVKKGFINLSPEEFLSEQHYGAWMTRGLPQEGDVLFTTEAPMGNAAVVRFEERFALAQRVINFRPYGGIHPDFLVLQLLAAPFQAILDKTATGLTAKGIKAAKLKRLPIAVPPLAEQHRIVAKVDELMALCDRLEAQLAISETESRRLLEAVLQEALLEKDGQNGEVGRVAETGRAAGLALDLVSRRV